MNFDTFNEIDYFTNLTSDNENNYINNNFNNEMNNKNPNLYGPYEGYIKGNLFKKLYDTYKNYQPSKLNITSEQDEMLLNVNELSFARHEMNLLLDNYPNNNNALNTFNSYRNMENKARENYERRFGPLEITSNDINNIPFAWEDDKWPWEI